MASPGPSTTGTSSAFDPSHPVSSGFKEERDALQLRLASLTQEGEGTGGWEEAEERESGSLLGCNPSPTPPLQRSKTKHINQHKNSFRSESWTGGLE